MKKKAAFVMALVVLTLQVSVSFAGKIDYPPPKSTASVSVVLLK